MSRRRCKGSQKKYLPRDEKGWIDAVKYKPERSIHFDLLMLMDDKGKTQQGWWTGLEWDYHPKKINNIIKWRFIECRERVPIT